MVTLCMPYYHVGHLNFKLSLCRKRKAQAIAACPKFEGARNSPVLKHENAWSGEHSSKSQPDSYSKPATPDSGLAPSLKGSKYGEPFLSEQVRSETPSSVQSSGKGSNSSTAGDNEDVFDEKMTETQASMRCVFGKIFLLKATISVLTLILFYLVKALKRQREISVDELLKQLELSRLHL